MADTYYNEETQTIKTKMEVIAEYPNTSFPQPVTDAILDEFGYKPILYVAPPSPSAPTKVVVQDGIEFDVNDGYKIKWVEQDRFSGDDKDTKDAEYQANLDTAQASIIRHERNRLLSETDWMAGSDVTMSDAWKTYRQALRDLPTHSNFPYLNAEDYPTKP